MIHIVIGVYHVRGSLAMPVCMLINCLTSLCTQFAKFIVAIAIIYVLDIMTSFLDDFRYFFNYCDVIFIRFCCGVVKRI